MIEIKQLSKSFGYKEVLKHVDLCIPTGSIFGLIGPNGSGKSTLLRAIGGIFSVDKGSIDLYGNKVSLLSIGVGFNYLLTGRENVILSGMLTGFSVDEIKDKMDAIIDFAEIGEFIDELQLREHPVLD